MILIKQPEELWFLTSTMKTTTGMGSRMQPIPFSWEILPKAEAMLSIFP